MVATALAVLTVVLIGAVYHPAIDLSHISDTFTPAIDQFRPEPVERAQYVAFILVFTLALLAATAVFYRRLRHGGIKPVFISRYRGWLLGFVLLAVAAFGCLGYSLDSNQILGLNYFLGHPVALTLAAEAVAAFLLLRQRIEAALASFRSVVAAGYAILAAMVILGVALFPVIDRYAINENLIFTDHFNAVFDSVAQVYNGKALLVNMVDQYGLYPHFLEPLFRLTGLSVYRFTLMMGALVGLSMLAVYLFLRDFVTSRTVLFLGFCAYAFYSYLAIQVVQFDPFFQGQPIRTIFPCLAILLVWKYLSSGRRYKRYLYFAIFVFGALATLWNFDTGLVVFLSWLLMLIYEELGRGRPAAIARAALPHVLAAAGIFVAVMLAFSGYIRLRYGAFPDFAAALGYQQTFYISGFYMLPMPAVNPWNLVALTYMFGLMFAARAAVVQRITARSRMIFFLSVLGAGIFSYYQGRSHDSVLTYVWYPAIILLIIFTDRLWTRTRRRRGDLVRTVALAAMLLAFLSAALNLFADGRMASLMANSAANASAIGPTPISRNADFIRSQVNPGSQVLILSYSAGIYYMESGASSPVSGPGTSELLLREDVDAIRDFIDGARGDKIIVDQNFVNAIHEWDRATNASLFALLQERYDRTATGPNGQIMVFSRRV